MLRRLCLGILSLPAFGCVLTAAPAGAQVEAEALKHYNACLDDTSNNHNVIQTSTGFIYTCFGGTAQSYFDYLVSKNAPETIDKQRTGTYIFRAIPAPQSGRCWTKTENVDEVETTTFGCSVNAAKQK